ncbi:discoidin, CUB and LCCL domain-containing protein 1-like [Protopterus annectens]|uniref:discoidin, CUB and LCCL domain-containing protein 1-like n=1 Tax=Protopterus annectens TaxID=7888 RepID=UPI001CFA41A9|nr:discoidin, CUB and LCCL domain-containing protein 1-like [Protopterus annectens]
MKSSNRCLVMCIGLGDQTVAVKLLGCLILVGVFPMMVFSELADRSVDGCGHTVMSRESGTLSSNNYPGPYPNNTSCTWKIRVAQGKAILLKFSDLDIETQSCELDYLKIVTVSSEEKTYCRTLDPEERELLLDTNEAKIQFASAVHVSGRGFLLSYATSDHSDLISCLDRSSHYTEEQYSKYCPAGCKDVAGDIFGDSSDGYRDTSVICKAAVHAGVIADESGGQITVIKSKVLGRYNVVRANGITSKEDSLSERIFLFNRTVRPDYINKLVDVSTDPTGITGNQNITEPISHQEADFGVKIGIAAAVVLCLFLLLAAVCIWQALHKRKSKGDAYRLSGDHGTG